jgi:uncharacterized protein YecE (DUF72 family)
VAVSIEDIRIGTAGWALPRAGVGRPDLLAARDSTLTRYARRLGATEVNSSFHRHHRTSTWERWAATTPDGFRFALKLPRAITHDGRLDATIATPVLDRFLDEIAPLGAKAGPLLVQLPPSLAFERRVAERWFALLRDRWSGGVVCEPRHRSWFEPAADELLVRQQVARVAADPAPVPAAAAPGGWDQLAYLRLHGSPKMSYSSYSDEFLEAVADRLRELTRGPAREVWCMFDNTASGAAFDDALRLIDLLGLGDRSRAAHTPSSTTSAAT